VTTIRLRACPSRTVRIAILPMVVSLKGKQRDGRGLPAQALRFAGECASALIAYRSFLRLSSNEEKKTLARGHELAMAVTCKSNAVSPDSTIAASRVQAPPALPDRFRRGRLAAKSTIVVGGLTVLAAGGVWLWNQGRFSSWQQEDARLQSPGAATLSVSDLSRRQDSNDSLLRSIRRTDHLGVGLAAGRGCRRLDGRRGQCPPDEGRPTHGPRRNGGFARTLIRLIHWRVRVAERTASSNRVERRPHVAVQSLVPADERYVASEPRPIWATTLVPSGSIV
jgi:hypothetical protein